MRLARTFHKIDRLASDQLRCSGLSSAQFDVLAHVGAAEGITQQELAERLLVTKGNICGMIGRMETEGWVERKPDPEDRRANRLFLTRQGKALLAQAAPRQNACPQCPTGRARPFGTKHRQRFVGKALICRLHCATTHLRTTPG